MTGFDHHVYDDYRDECRDHLDAMEEDLCATENASEVDEQRANRLFRAVVVSKNRICLKVLG
jgi:chemotaxis protein histidine kinase CheA